eukprot:GHVR01002597.1.p2 GENE.GHVR01002597.1~~GHVR01002597.1.p2  ORF type:complete len:132 (+),score=13.69 GHVR01002597.1:1013-1408(+)
MNVRLLSHVLKANIETDMIPSNVDDDIRYNKLKERDAVLVEGTNKNYVFLINRHEDGEQVVSTSEIMLSVPVPTIKPVIDGAVDTPRGCQPRNATEQLRWTTSVARHTRMTVCSEAVFEVKAVLRLCLNTS